MILGSKHVGAILNVLKFYVCALVGVPIKWQTGVSENGGRGIILYRAVCGGIYLVREGVTRGWRKLHNKELHDFCCTADNVASIN